MVSAQIASRIADTTQSASLQGVQMRYEERTFDIGDVQMGGVQKDLLTIVPLPGAFGTALSFVAMLSNSGCEPGPGRDAPQWLWWTFLTSVDGENWLGVQPPGVTSFLVLQANTAAGARLHGPFGNHLALKIGGKRGHMLDDIDWLPGKWLGVRLSMGVQCV